MATPSIDIQGLLQNSHNSGVSISDALFEKIDDSLSAGSTEFRWVLSQEDGLISSDNGHGMTKDKLQQSCRLHSRTTSSGERHGRFGIGSKNAEWILTNLEGSVTKLSSDGNRISQVTINYPNIMKNEETYEPRAHGIEEESRPIWDKYAINPSGSGTITQMHIPAAKRSELIEMFSNDTVTGIRFKISTTYRDALTKGIKMSIQSGETFYEIHPIDRLCVSLIETNLARNIQIQTKFKTYNVDHMRTIATGEIVSHVLSSDGTMRTCFDKIQKKLIHVSESIDLFEIVGHTRVSFAYSNDWAPLQKDDLEKNGITPLTKGQEGVPKFRAQTNGMELVRNGKILKHIQSKPMTKGDKAAYKYHENTRTRAEFVANDQMDTLYNVQVNKSQVDEDLIDKRLWKTIEILRETFVGECYKEYDPVKSAIESSQVVHVNSLSGSSPSVLLMPISHQPLLSEKPVSSGSKPKHILATRVRAHIISDSDSESEPDNERGAGVVARSGGVTRIVATVTGGGCVVGRGGTAATATSTPKEMPNFVPDSECAVGSSKHQFILRKTGENILSEWKKSGKYMATLDETLDKMHIEFSGNLAADTLKRYLNRIPLNEKYDLLLEMIREKYASPETRMKGIELQRVYNKTFEADIAAGIAKGM